MDQATTAGVVSFATDALGRLDILVNNARIIQREASVDMSLNDWQRSCP